MFLQRALDAFHFLVRKLSLLWTLELARQGPLQHHIVIQYHCRTNLRLPWLFIALSESRTTATLFHLCTYVSFLRFVIHCNPSFVPVFLSPSVRVFLQFSVSQFSRSSYHFEVSQPIRYSVLQSWQFFVYPSVFSFVQPSPV